MVGVKEIIPVKIFPFEKLSRFKSRLIKRKREMMLMIMLILKTNKRKNGII